MKPTEEQIKEFWERCGFESRMMPNYSADNSSCNYVWFNPEGIGCYKLPPLDLNNLFEYAVPKVDTLVQMEFGRNTEGYFVVVGYADETNIFSVNDQDPALALFWALYPVLKEASNETKKANVL